MSDHVHDPAALDLSWDDMHAGAMAELPSGPVWPRDPDGVLSRTVRGLIGPHWWAWQRVRGLLDEADPRTIYETISMWETDCGLPDPCVQNPPTAIEARRAAVIARRQEGATTTPMDFIALAAKLGYEIEIIEFRPFRTYSDCDDFLNTSGDVYDASGNLLGVSVGWPHCWLVNFVNADPVVYVMRCNSPCTAFLREWASGEVECVFERIKPAHTKILWAYAGGAPITYWDNGIGLGTVWDNSQSRWDGMVYPL